MKQHDTSTSSTATSSADTTVHPDVSAASDPNSANDDKPATSDPNAADADKSTNPDHTGVISDYNGYDYKKIFWEDADRQYEDLADRLALRRLLPQEINNFIDIAGGYGRLADEYLPRAAHATLFDYSESELAQARQKYGDALQTRSGDIFSLPFPDSSFDALIMVRATHHLSDLSRAIAELYRVLKPGGVAIIEVANKRTLPKILRYWSGKSQLNPFSLEPSHLRELNAAGFYNYHPKYVEKIFKSQGFMINKVLSVSNFRSARLKHLFGTDTLARLEKPAQTLLAPIRFAPSIYYRLVKP